MLHINFTQGDVAYLLARVRWLEQGGLKALMLQAWSEPKAKWLVLARTTVQRTLTAAMDEQDRRWLPQIMDGIAFHVERYGGRFELAPPLGILGVARSMAKAAFTRTYATRGEETTRLRHQPDAALIESFAYQDVMNDIRQVIEQWVRDGKRLGEEDVNADGVADPEITANRIMAIMGLGGDRRDYAKLFHSSYQQDVADRLAARLEAYLESNPLMDPDLKEAVQGIPASKLGAWATLVAEAWQAMIRQWYPWAFMQVFKRSFRQGELDLGGMV